MRWVMFTPTPCFPASQIQLAAIEKVQHALDTHEYITQRSTCPICGSTADGVEVSTFDRNGFFCPVIQCCTCGLLRNKEIFTEETCAAFYKNDYHKMTFGSDFANRDYFYEQNKIGLRYYKIVQSVLGNFSEKKIVEIGCSSGGILYPFMRRNNFCIGYAYNKNYMDFGRRLGLDLRQQDGTIEDNADILIFSHCLEHIPNPVEMLSRIQSSLKPGGIILAEVPNIYRFTMDYISLQHYFTIAHLFHFTPYHFSLLIKKAGFEPCFQNEYTTIIAKKTGSTSPSESYDISEKHSLSSFISDFSSWHKPSQNTVAGQGIKRYLRKLPFYSGLKNIYRKQFRKPHIAPTKFHTCYIEGEDITASELQEIKTRASFYGCPEISTVYLPDSSIPDSFPVLSFGSTQHADTIFDIDWRLNPLDAWEWCRFSDYVHAFSSDIEESKNTFQNWVDKVQKLSKAYIFGTGPSLDKAIEHDWSDGYRIVCNTIVKNSEMWHHISPHIIVAGDALYHFSNEKFAKHFRHDLQLRLSESPKCIFVYPQIFDGMVRRTMEISNSQLVPVPCGAGTDFHHTMERFELPALGNVLGLLLLPIASYLSKNVYLWGFDGKAPSDSLFWKNSTKEHYSDDVDDLRRHHPAFYSFFCPDDKKNFYEQLNFGDLLEKAFCTAEQDGWTFTMLHPSWTSILSKRFVQK